MNKKGFSNVFFVFLFVIAFVFYIAPIHLKLSSKPIASEGIGADAIKLINSYDVVSDFKIYLDKSAELASCQALYDMGKNGGYLDNKCGEERGYAKWDTNCNPLASLEQKASEHLSLEQKHSKYFDSEFKKHIDFKPNYAYSFDKGNFLGKTDDKIEKTSEITKYYVNPSFSIKPKLDLKTYRDIAERLNDKRVCFSNENPEDCVKDDNWKMKKEGKLVFFDIENDAGCVVREGNQFLDKKIKIKFFRDFTKEELLAIKTPDLLK